MKAGQIAIFLMRLELQKRSVLKFASRIIPIAKRIGINILMAKRLF